MQQSKQQLENLVNLFNGQYKVRDKVLVMKWSDGSETFEDEISHEATIMGGHTVMTWLKNMGSWDISFVIKKI